jgi:hypothetical protein
MKKNKTNPVTTGTHPPVTNTEKDQDDLAHQKATVVPKETEEQDLDDLAHQTGETQTHDKGVIPPKGSNPVFKK